MFPVPFKTILALMRRLSALALADGLFRWSADIFLANDAVNPDDHSKPRAAIVHGKKFDDFGTDARRTSEPASVSARNLGDTT